VDVIVNNKSERALKGYYGRMRLFKQYGYDMMKARSFLLNKSGIKNSSVLEVGTGRGHLAVGLAKKGIRFVTIDLDRKVLFLARRNLKGHGVLKFACIKLMDARKLNFRDEEFDHVISSNFIHHAKYPEQCIKEMIRVARRSITIADLNKRGEAIMSKVHQLDGRKHARSLLSLKGIKEQLDRSGLDVKVHRDTCQTVLVAKKRIKL
jgi:ubiquinone/menaquinone biosynthesis C-methylase UbiE